MFVLGNASKSAGAELSTTRALCSCPMLPVLITLTLSFPAFINPTFSFFVLKTCLQNGFKLHCQSEGHQRQMLLVAENPGKVVHNNSEEFKNTFLSLLRRSYNTRSEKLALQFRGPPRLTRAILSSLFGRRVHCNIVYNDYISDKQHLHMNSTR